MAQSYHVLHQDIDGFGLMPYRNELYGSGFCSSVIPQLPLCEYALAELQWLMTQANNKASAEDDFYGQPHQSWQEIHSA